MRFAGMFGERFGGLRPVHYLYAVLGASVLCAVLFLAHSFRQSPAVIETVTTDALRPNATPSASPLYFKPQLPARDAAIEQVGDHIAEAEVYLKKRQSAAALAAITKARKATSRALEAKQDKNNQSKRLLLTLRELENIERVIRRGALDEASRQLVVLDKNLDQLDF